MLKRYISGKSRLGFFNSIQCQYGKLTFSTEQRYPVERQVVMGSSSVEEEKFVFIHIKNKKSTCFSPEI